MAVHRVEVDAGEDRGLGALLNRLIGDVVRLLDQKLALLKLELTEELAAAVRRSALLAVGAVVAALGGFFLILALAIGLGELVGTTAGGFAIVGGAFVLAGLVLLIAMRRRLADVTLVPRETVRELRRDKAWIKHEL
jgi:uncharacterized membrane protein YqjE